MKMTLHQSIISVAMSLLVGGLLSANPVMAAEDIYDESLESIMKMKTELKADVGSRDGARNFLDSRAPVDVITAQQIETSGLTSLTNVLRYFVPGFNAPEASLADGSNHLKIFTLRGMSPDQVLVLINGKRLHTTALLHVNGVIGRGTSGVDLDSIAVNSIEKVEILRDGAAAQYGSDAISGVINIILKGIGNKNSISALTGIRKKGDGKHVHAEAFLTFPLKYDGFFNMTFSGEVQEQTQRAGADRRLVPPVTKTHFGLQDSTSYNAVLNLELPQENDLTYYANAILNRRDSEGSAFFRTPDITRPIFPNGFLPMTTAQITDGSLVVGATGLWNAIHWDLSNVLGYSDFNTGLRDSMNYSLGAQSPTSFDTGSLSFLQDTLNLDFKRHFDSVDLAWGGELRHENYQIKAGEVASYTGTGSQGFVGFSPENETDSSRNSFALYLNSTYSSRDIWSLEGAVRYENFSDFGSTTNFKLSGSYKVLPGLLFRISGSTGFRAPSLSQSFYSQTSTYVDPGTGIIYFQGTYRPDHPVSVSLGAKSLKAEKSRHFTFGTVLQPTKDISLMLDFYQTSVDDRIMLSNNLGATTPAQIAIFNAYGVSQNQGARFMTNAVNTKTEGVDAKLNIHHDFPNSSEMNLGIWYSYNNNKVVRYNDTATTFANSFDQIVRAEHGQPQSAVRILGNYEVDKLNLTVNLSNFGSYQQVVNGVAHRLEPKWTTDLDVAYQLTKNLKVTAGGINVFDAYPSKWKDLNGIGYGSNGILPYSMHAPFGVSGAYYYLRVTLGF